MKRFLMLGIAAVSLAAVGCGGGEGGGSSGVAINYKGEKSQVAFTEDNYQQMAETSAEGQLAWDLFGAESPLRAPASLQRILAEAPSYAKAALGPMATESRTQEGSCGGTLTLTASQSGASASQKVVYDEYCDGKTTDGYIYDGYIKLSGKQSVSGDNYTATFGLAVDLTVEERIINMSSENPLSLLPTVRGNLTFKLRGNNVVKVDDDEYNYTITSETFDINMLLADPAADAFIWVNDLTVVATFDELESPSEMTIDGRVYFSEDGYVKYTTDEPLDLAARDYGRLLIDGANGSGLKMELDNGQWTAYLETGEQTPDQYDEGTYTFSYL